MNLLPDKIAKLIHASESAARDISDLLASATRAAENILQGQYALGKTGTGEKFWQFREYREGDRPQDVDWRQSAKGDRLFIRQKERENQQTILLHCAAGPEMHFRSGRRLPFRDDAAHVLIVALALLSMRMGDRAGLLNGKNKPGNSREALEDIAAELMENAHRPVTPPPAKNAFIILAGDFLNEPEAFEKNLSALSETSSGGLVLQILDPAEITFPYTGRAIFTAPGGYDRTIVPDAASVRQVYLSRIHEHLGHIESLCGRYGWAYALHRTDTPYRATLERISALLHDHGRHGP